MYRFTLAWLLAFCIAGTTCAQERQTMDNRQSDTKTLVAYFSATGTTARAAETLAAVTGGTLFPITPAEPYTAADLNWHDRNSRSSVEMNDPSSRPAIKGMPEDIAGYDTIFIGYPIWWGLAPRIVNTFIESLGGDKKTIIPFATSGGSGITGSVSALKSAYPGHDWKEGRLLNTTDRNTVRSWTDSLGL